jgi:maltose-binding protein MalE
MKSHAIAALLLLLTLGAGCGGGKSGPTEITLLEMMDPKERELLAVHVAAFQATHPDVRVVTSHLGVEDLRSKFLTAALGGGGPDIVYGPSDNIGPFSIAGTIRPLDDVFGAAFFERFHPLTQDRLDGHLWAVPEQFGNHLVFVYNKALVPEPPLTTDEMIALAKAQTVDEDGDGRIDRYGIAFESKEPFWLVPWLGGFGGWVMDDAGRPTLDTPAMREALAFLRDLKTVHGVLPKDCDYQLASTLFQEGRAAMTINGPWSWPDFTGAGVDIGLAPIPQISGAGWPTPMVSYRGYLISRSCPDDELPAAKELIEWLTGPEVQRDYAERIGSLPSLVELQEDPEVQSDPVLSRSMEQVRLGRRMPVIPEMRAIWDAMRPQMQNVMNGESTPEEAARAMQEDATEKIAEMNG